MVDTDHAGTQAGCILVAVFLNASHLWSVAPSIMLKLLLDVFCQWANIQGFIYYLLFMPKLVHF